MTHPIVALQGALVAAWKADETLAALVGEAIFDAPPKGQVGACVVVMRHDVRPRDGDLAPGLEHRLLLHVWSAEASRRAALAIAEPLVAVAMAAGIAEPVVTFREHAGTDTAIDLKTGRARAAVTLRFFSEPAA